MTIWKVYVYRETRFVEHVGAGALDDRRKRVVGQGAGADGTFVAVFLDHAIPRLTPYQRRTSFPHRYNFAGVFLMHLYLQSDGGASSRHARAVVTPGIKRGG